MCACRTRGRGPLPCNLHVDGAVCARVRGSVGPGGEGDGPRGLMTDSSRPQTADRCVLAVQNRLVLQNPATAARPAAARSVRACTIV